MNGPGYKRAGWLIALGAILIGVAVYGAAQIEQNAALHAATAEQQSQRLLTAMLDQETGARGFFMTGNRQFLAPWYAGTADFAHALRAAQQTARGDRALERSLSTQARIAAEWHASVTAAIGGFERDDVAPTVAAALGRKALMDSFRAANENFDQLLSARRGSALSRAGLDAIVIVVVLSVTLALAALLLLSRSAHRALRRRQDEQELRELLQVSRSEEESRQLLVRHIERAVPGAGAAVLNRNNSDDRLEPSLSASAQTTPLCDLPREELQPASCLAVRLSRSYDRRRGEESLAECSICGGLAGDVQCEPLLVGGKVIGSVLVAREGRIDESTRSQVRDAVVQAAPIVANQRNLALAEARAASDPLTGLPNRRAADDTLKRMAAHAGRSASRLTAILLDLDHFKRINDVHGHEQGDEALAAVGGILTTSLRASDFAARFGGEKFLVLLPDTPREQAGVVAEKLRALIAEAVVGAEGVTASFGVATLPDDATDPDSLLRKADRALYLAKRTGRNRVALATAVTVDVAEPAAA